MMRRLALLLAVISLGLGGCDLAPRQVMPDPAVAVNWPQGAAYGAEQNVTPGMPWRTLIADARLQAVIEQALAHNQDLRSAIASVASARAQYHIERSYQLPTVAAGASASIVRGLPNKALDSQEYSVDVGVSSFELDLFGRLRNQSRAAFETYLSTESGMRSTRMTVIAETAVAYITLASDRERLEIARQTMSAGQRSLDLTRALFKSGLDSGVDVQDAITVVEQANSDVADDTTLAAQDRNALELLVGAPVGDDLLPGSLADLDRSVGTVPAGLSSTVLLQRPDVVEAEHSLRSANANIGAARAAYFPAITLTSAVGVASTALSDLFTHGALEWSASPSATVPIFGGPNAGNLQYAKAQRDYYVAQYQKAVQSAFRDVANGLARRGTVTQQRQAQARLVAAAQKAYSLADAQYRAGTGAFLDAGDRSRFESVVGDVSDRAECGSALRPCGP
jgi:multidrug efflux system outer membrane protein